MNATTMDLPNSRAKLQERLQAGRITWRWPAIIVFARLLLAKLGQALIAGLYMLTGHPTPWQAAAPWWIVYGTMIDIGCFVLLARLARQEGIRLLDLISFQRHFLGKDLLLGVGFIPLFIILAAAGGITTGLLIYGATRAPATKLPLPLWGTLYSLIVWPINYLRTCRLVPFIIAHWAANFVAVLMTVVLPMLTP
jgi:hypothetical protein